MYYSLVGVDGNAYSIMGYTAEALRETGHRDLVDKMLEEATSSNYDHLICVCLKYVDIANEGVNFDEEFEWDGNSQEKFRFR